MIPPTCYNNTHKSFITILYLFTDANGSQVQNNQQFRFFPCLRHVTKTKIDIKNYLKGIRANIIQKEPPQISCFKGIFKGHFYYFKLLSFFSSLFVVNNNNNVCFPVITLYTPCTFVSFYYVYRSIA